MMVTLAFNKLMYNFMKKLRFVGHKLDNKSNGEEKKYAFRMRKTRFL